MAPAAVEEAPAAAEHPILLEKKNIVLNCKPVSPEEAIKAVGRAGAEPPFRASSSSCTRVLYSGAPMKFLMGMIRKPASLS